jgi:hypothetical protein
MLSGLIPPAVSRKSLALMAILAIVWGSAARAADDCQVTLSRPVVDYGRWVPGEGDHPARGSLYTLDESDVVVTAFCSTPRKMALFFTGVARDDGFLFGDRGSMTVEAFQPLLDGRRVRLGKSAGQGTVNTQGAPEDRVIVHNNDGLAPVDDGLTAAGQQIQVTLRLKPQVSTGGLKPADQTLVKSALNIRVEAE